MNILKLRAGDAVTGFVAAATASALIAKPASAASSISLLTRDIITSPSSLLLLLNGNVKLDLVVNKKMKNPV